MGTLHFLGEEPPVEYTVKVRHHFNGKVEICVMDVGSSPDDRKKIADALMEAAIMIENNGDFEPVTTKLGGR